MQRYRTALCAIFFAMSAPALADLVDGAAVHPPLHGQVPKASDVIFSSRFTRPQAIPLIRAFGATRVEWVYTDDADFVAGLKQAAPWFGGTVNANGPLPDESGFARGFDGELLVAPWMKAWDDRWWITTTHASTQQVLGQQVKRLIDLGADSVQVDDALLQVFAGERLGGDFNPATVAGFPAWLKAQADPKQVAAAGLTGFSGNYHDWLRDHHGVTSTADYQQRFRSFPSTALWLAYLRTTVLDHFERVRKQAATLRGRPVPLSMNLGSLTMPLQSNPFFFLAPVADYALAEARTEDWLRLVSQAATMRSLGLAWAPSLMPRERAANRTAIASLYALGGNAVVPWDAYAGNDAQGKGRRFFGTPADYGDLYAFVRRHPALLDGFEPAALVGVLVPVDRADERSLRRLVQRLLDRQIPFAYVPLGGSAGYTADAARLRHLRLLVSTQADAELPTEAVAAMVASGVQRRTATGLTNAELDALRPFVLAPGAEAIRLLPRADAARPGSLMLHVVDTRRGEPGPVDEACRTRVGIRTEALPQASVTSATWHRGLGSLAIDPELAPNSNHVFFNLAGCTLWGVLELKLAPR